MVYRYICNCNCNEHLFLSSCTCSCMHYNQIIGDTGGTWEDRVMHTSLCIFIALTAPAGNAKWMVAAFSWSENPQYWHFMQCPCTMANVPVGDLIGAMLWYCEEDRQFAPFPFPSRFYLDFFLPRPLLRPTLPHSGCPGQDHAGNNTAFHMAAEWAVLILAVAGKPRAPSSGPVPVRGRVGKACHSNFPSQGSESNRCPSHALSHWPNFTIEKNIHYVHQNVHL